MREILFRGLTAVGSMWVRGSLLIDERNNSYIGILLHSEDTSHSITCGRTNGKTMNRFIGTGFAMVNPETVGQWTGLVDKNGVQIFEGDIVKFDDILGFINYNTGCYCVRTNKLDWKGRYNPAIDIILNADPNEIKVVGNIHDNPELLQKE